MRVSIFSLGRILTAPASVFAELSGDDPNPWQVFFGLTLWLLVCPPVFALLGTTRFGWLLGVEPLLLPTSVVLGISAAYLATLIFGFFSTVMISRWMTDTYAADASLGRHFALISVVGAPLAVGSIVHLYPHAFINVLTLIPALIWSLYLLYRGVPAVLGTGPERGMLMASSIVGYLLVAWVSLIGITVVLWSSGYGPRLGI